MQYKAFLEAGQIVIQDEKDFAGICFTMDEIKEVYRQYPKYFTPEVLVEIFHYQVTEEWEESRHIIPDIENRIVGRPYALPIEYGLDLVGDGYEWIMLDYKEQVQIVAEHILEVFSSPSEKILQLIKEKVDGGASIQIDADSHGYFLRENLHQEEALRIPFGYEGSDEKGFVRSLYFALKNLVL